MKNMNRGDKSGFRSRRILATLILLLTAYCLLPTVLYAAQEMLKTQKVKVGEKVPLTDALKKVNEDGKAIALLLLSNPMQCNGCDEMVSLFEEETKRYKDNVAFVVKGGQDMRGALDEDTVALKRLYGFVTMGKPWVFFIDKEGILRKILMGPFTREELEGILDNIIGRKE